MFKFLCCLTFRSMHRKICCSQLILFNRNIVSKFCYHNEGWIQRRSLGVDRWQNYNQIFVSKDIQKTSIPSPPVLNNKGPCLSLWALSHFYPFHCELRFLISKFFVESILTWGYIICNTRRTCLAESQCSIGRYILHWIGLLFCLLNKTSILPTDGMVDVKKKRWL